MSLSSVRFAIRILYVAFGGILAFAFASPAQTIQQGQQQQTNTQASINQVNAMQQQLHLLTDVQKQTGQVDPREQAACEKFLRANVEDPDKKIQLGRDFLAKYPNSIFTGLVESGLVSAYYAKQDWGNFYSTADKALAINPDDVDVLSTVGWVIPHLYNPNDPNAGKQLNEAEAYEKHAVVVLEKMPKPKDVTDAQFDASKAQKSSQIHSALGLVYFRRSDYDNSAKELLLATQATPTPDQADLYVLGIDLQNLKRFGEAADAFNRCSLAPGGLQDRCKQNEAAARKQIK
jgi:tetratricopeptide (TPR) repeat protein